MACLVAAPTSQESPNPRNMEFRGLGGCNGRKEVGGVMSAG